MASFATITNPRPLRSIYCWLISDDPETTTYSTTTEDYDLDETEEELEEERKLANKFLLEKLLQRLNRQKRSPEAHGVEMLLAIDHAVYDE